MQVTALQPFRTEWLENRYFSYSQYAASIGKLYLDIVGYADIMTEENILLKKRRSMQISIKIILNSEDLKYFWTVLPQGKTAWMTKPYEGEKEYCGYPIHGDEELKKYICVALDKKQQLLAHCNGDAAAEQYVCPVFEQTLKERKEKDIYRAVMVHAQLVRKDQLERMAVMGDKYEFLCCTHILLGRYSPEKFRRRKRKSDFSGRRRGRVKHEIYVSSGYTRCSAGYVAYNFISGKQSIKNRTEYWQKSMCFRVGGTEGSDKLCGVSVYGRK